MATPLSAPADHRRKWDTDEFERMAKERADAEKLEEILKEGRSGHNKEPPVKRELLKPRDYRVDLDSKLGKSHVITKTTPASGLAGYYCKVCDCTVKDSINFLDHINGKKHQRNLGMSMRVERSSLDQVKKRFEMNKKKKDEKDKEYDFEERVRELKEEEEKHKAYKKEKRKAQKRKANDDMEEEEGGGDMAALMGFSGFGTTKK
jgi:U4/U6.U5 tri-snRNP component SNU23